MTRRTQVGLIVVGTLALIVAANWYAITVHIGNLRSQADRLYGDSGPELRAQADDFHGAQIGFAALTVALTVTFLVLAARAIQQSRRTNRIA
jgi:hypothetical protein